MDSSMFVGLVNNAALLLMLALLYDMLPLRPRAQRPTVQQALTGLILGGIGLLVMLTPLHLTPGVVFDTRSVLLCVSGLFFGTVPTVIAMLMTGAFRLYQGGAGAWTGVAVILASGGIGLAWRHLRRGELETIVAGELYVLGLVVHIVMLLLMLTLPWPLALDVLSKISLPVLVIYPVGTTLLGLLMAQRLARRRAQAALQESEERWQFALEGAGDGVWDWNAQTNQVFYSRQWKSMLGFQENEMGGTLDEWTRRVHPDDREHVQAEIAKLLEDRTPIYVNEHRVQCKDGSYKWILDRGKVIHRTDDGKPQRVIGTHSDITGRKQIEDALRQSEAKYRTLFENSVVGIFQTTLEGRLLTANQALARMYGYASPDEMVADVTDVARQLYARPQDRQEVLRILAEQGVLGPSEYAVIRRDGTPFWISLTSREVRDAEGRLRYFEGTEVDITEHKRMDAALRESEERYRTLFEQAHDAIHVDNERDEIVDVNQRAVELFGYSRQELLSMTVADLQPPERRRPAGSILKDERVRYGNATFEAVDLRRDGSRIPVEISVTPVRSARGNLYMSMVRDITERKRVEEALRESEENLRRAQRAAHVGSWQFDLNTKRVVASEEAGRIYGLGNREWSIKEAQMIPLPEYRALLDAALQGLIEQGRPYDIEFRIRRPTDGALLDIHSVAEYDRERNAVFGAIQDITERKQAQEALRESEWRNRVVAEMMTDYIFIVDVERTGLLKLRWASDSMTRMTGRTVADAATSDMWKNIIHPDDTPAFFGYIQRILTSGEAGVFECRTFTKPGAERWIEISAQPHKDDSGAISYIIGAIKDVSERKQAEEEIRRINAELEQRVEARTAELQVANAALVRAARMKDEFLANMSHELRTPLTGILGLSEALQLGVYGPLADKQLHSLATIHESGQHLLALITDVLDLAKIEAGTLTLQIDVVSAPEVCRVSLQLVKQSAAKKRLDMVFRHDAHVTTLQADGRRLKQMLVNLLGNAIKFTPEGGQIGLQVEGDTAQGEVRFIVWDTGIGIPPEKQALLFQPFVQLDSSLSRQYEGAGLGLALVRRMAELHEGSIMVESEGVGRGARFILTLPWQAPPATAQAAAESVLGGRPSMSDSLGRTPTVLVVDDNPSAADLLADFLAAQGCRAKTANDGHAALQQARELIPDAILMDIQMPGMDGLETIHQMRAEPALARTAIVALTALAMPGDRERCLEAGANDYLSKPIRLPELAQTLLRVLAA